MIHRAAGAILLLGCTAAPPPAEEADRLYREALFRLSRAEDPAEALHLLDRAIGLDPDRASLRTARAGARRAAGRTAEALEDLTAALRLLETQGAPPAEQADLLVRRAEFLAGLERLPQAETDLTAALRLIPAHVEALLRRADARRRMGRPAEAERDVEEARRAGAGRADLFFNDGVRALHLRRKEEAEFLFRSAVDLNPRHVPARVALARVFLESRRFEEAARTLERAVELEPQRADLHYHQGNARLGLGRDEEAAGDYARAIELDPSQPSYRTALAVALQRLGKTDRARDELERALKIDPAYPPAWTAYASLLRQLGRLDEAERRARRAIELSATPDALEVLGLVLLEKGDPRRAAEAFDKALQICHDAAFRTVLEGNLERALKAQEKEGR